MNKKKSAELNEKSLYHPYDSFFKCALNEPKVARELLIRCLPKGFLKRTDLNSVKVESNTFIDEQLNSSAADVLLSAKMGKHKCYFYILAEQQSNPQKIMPFRLVSYIIQIIAGHLKKYKTNILPIVYPVVLYTGRRPYNYSMDILDLFGQNRDLAKSIYSQPFQLIDVNKEDDNELQKYPYFGLVEYIFKHTHARDLMKHLTVIGPMVQYIDRAGYGNLAQAVYVFATHKASARDVLSFRDAYLKYLQPQTKEKVMTMAEQLKQIGFEEGVIQGQHVGWQAGRDEGWRAGRDEGKLTEKQDTAKNLLRLGVSKSIIQRATGLSDAQLQNLALEVEVMS